MPLSILTRSRRHLATAAAATLFAATLMTACGTSDDKSTTGNGSGSASASAVDVDAMKKDVAAFTKEVTAYPASTPIEGGVSNAAGKTIWYVPLGAAVPGFNAFGIGIKEALNAAGVNFKTCDGKFLPTTVADCLAQAASQGADGVITAYVDYKLVPAAFDALVDAKIPVLIAGSANNYGKPNSSQVAFDDTLGSYEAAQRLIGESVILDSDGKANVVFVATTESPQTADVAAFTKKFYEDNCPDCSFTQVEYTTANIQGVGSQVSAALVSNPATDYVVCMFDAAAQAALSGIQSAGFASKVKLSAGGGGTDFLQRIKEDKTEFVDAGTSASYLGWRFADGMLRMLAGGVPETIDKPVAVRLFNKDNVADLDLTPEAYNTNAWYGEDIYKDIFSAAWGIG